MIIISGGQTGVDRMGLEVAKKFCLKTGGWAPKGYRTDMGPDPSLANFQLVEDESDDYRPRTIKNATESDFTLWFGNTGSPGGKLTKQAARGRFRDNPTPAQVYYILSNNPYAVINIAGNRASTNPQASRDCERVLTEVFTRLQQEGKIV